MSKKKSDYEISILGTRGIPAEHGGFETFAEHFSLYLNRRGWSVTVYCQEKGDGPLYEDDWHGIHRVHIPVTQEGAKGTIVFDWRSTLHAVQKSALIMTLGYNTAIFCGLYRLKGIKNVINMDGLEWRRGKWNRVEQTWLYLNERFGAWFGNHLVADHPQIKNHLAKIVSPDKITVIPYSAEFIDSADHGVLKQFGLQPGKYTILIARPEPENSILEIVGAYSRKKREMPLVVLGYYAPETNLYHETVMEAAGAEIKFVGAIYDKQTVQALRFHSRLYIHGHTVGGTNPSLVEALGAGSPVLAHDNRFNRWVAGDEAHFFSSELECSDELDRLLNADVLLSEMRTHSHDQYLKRFTDEKIHSAYEHLLKAMSF